MMSSKVTGLCYVSKRFVHSFMRCTSICAYIFYDYPQSCDQLLYAVRCESRPNSDMRMLVDQQPSHSIASIRTLIPSCCSVVDFGYPLLLSFIRRQLLWSAYYRELGRLHVSGRCEWFLGIQFGFLRHPSSSSGAGLAMEGIPPTSAKEEERKRADDGEA